MGRQPCCDKVGLKKGPWTSDEDKKLINFILTNGQCCWRALPKLAGLLRCGKSCRLRWTNYLRPDLKRGLLSEDEEQLVIQLHSQLGNRWSKIASHLPGRTDNEIKNHWNTHIKKKLKKMGIDPLTHKPLPPPPSPSPSPSPIDDQDQNDQEFEANINETISVQSSTITDAERSPISQLIDDFCIDEVPLVEPHEILQAPNSNNSSPTSSSTSSSSFSTSESSSCIINSPNNNNNNNNNSRSNNDIVADFQELLPTFDWQQYDQITTNNINSNNNNNNDISNNIGNNNLDMGLIWDDDFISNLDLLLNDDGESDKGGLLSFQTTNDDYLTNYSRMVLDEECLKYEQLL